MWIRESGSNQHTLPPRPIHGSAPADHLPCSLWRRQSIVNDLCGIGQKQAILGWATVDQVEKAEGETDPSSALGEKGAVANSQVPSKDPALAFWWSHCCLTSDKSLTFLSPTFFLCKVGMITPTLHDC